MGICPVETKFFDNMDFSITMEANFEASEIILIQGLSNALETYFEDKYYGQDIRSFMINLICVKPEFEFFFKERKPVYIENEIDKTDGLNLPIVKQYSYDIKLSYYDIINKNNNNMLKKLALEIASSLSYLDSMPKKIRDFDKERFKDDLINYFKSNGLLDQDS